MALKIWIGKRESDILTYDFFDASITFWGSNTGNNRSFCTEKRIKDNYGIEFTKFVLVELNRIIEKQNDIEIHFYNNSFAYKIIAENPELKNYIVNLNNKRIIDIARHKTLARVWLQNDVLVPSFTYISKFECTYDSLINKFPGYKKFVVQKNISGGGDGTYLITEGNCKKIYTKLQSDDVYLVSPYYENSISLSCHILIDNNQVIVFPVSEQLLNYRNSNISYCGNKYLDAQNKLSCAVKKSAEIVGNKLKEIEYRGICGFDFIFADNKLMLIEINPRYQGSSYAINEALKECNIPSLFVLNSMCFNDGLKKETVDKIENLTISYESHTIKYQAGLNNSEISYPKNSIFFPDGLMDAKIFDDNVYLYRYLISTQS